MKARRLHLALTVIWALLLAPTLLWWRDSILWIAAMSLYANVAGHWSAYQAARAEHADDDRPPGATMTGPADPSRAYPNRVVAGTVLLKAPNGTLHRLLVADDGALSSEIYSPPGAPGDPPPEAPSDPLTITNVSAFTGVPADGGSFTLTGTGLAGIADVDVFTADRSVQVAAFIHPWPTATSATIDVAGMPGGYNPATSQWYVRISNTAGDWSGVHGTDWTDITAPIFAT